jgi:ESX secretion system ATPase EccB
MKTRRDQVQAHAYMVGRLTCALVHAEPDAAETPMRRTTLGSFGGLVIGAILVAGFLVWGLIFPGGKAGALTSGTLIVAKQTGSRYLYLGRVLRPVLNWASARLLLGGKPQVQMVPDAVLADVPQGPPLGIVGAPDALPPSPAVSRSGWLACSPPGSGPGAGPLVTVTIGGPVAATPLPGHSALLVQAAGNSYLLWHGARLRIDAPWIRDALGLGSAPVVPVNPAWLDAVPAGPDLRPLAVPGLGGQGPVIGGHATRIGQVLDVRNVGSPDGFYVVEAGSVSPVTRTQAALALTDPATAAAYPGASPAPVVMTTAMIAGVPQNRSALPDGRGVPVTPPAADAPPPAQAPCVDYPGGTRAPHAAIMFAASPAGQPPAAGSLGVTTTPEVADRIAVRPGTGALVRPEAAPGVKGDSEFLVTGLGVKFPVPSAAAAAALGYQASAAEPLPAALLALLPTGPALDLAPLPGAAPAAITANPP